MIQDKKILCISVMESWGGGELYLLNLVRQIKDYEFIIASPKGRAFDTFSSYNIDLIQINRLRKIFRKSEKWSLFDKLKILFNITLVTIQLVKIISSKKIDLIFANGNFAAFYSIFSAKLTKRKLVAAQHLIYNNQSTEAKILKFLIPRVEAMICVSNAVTTCINQIAGEDAVKNTSVIHNGIEIPFVEERIPGSEKLNIGFVGSIIKQKGLKEIITALNPIFRQNKYLIFHVFGTTVKNAESQNYYAEILSLINSFKLDDKIIFHGHITSKDDIYNKIDILINFSVSDESLGYNILEAMSYSKVVIGSNAGGVPEIIEDNKSGFLVEQNDIIHLTKKIKYCVENFNSPMMVDVRRNASNTIATKFSLEQFTLQYKNMFNSIFQ